MNGLNSILEATQEIVNARADRPTESIQSKQLREKNMDQMTRGSKTGGKIPNGPTFMVDIPERQEKKKNICRKYI